MWESVNIEKAAPGPLKATLNPGAARSRRPKAELLPKLSKRNLVTSNQKHYPIKDFIVTPAEMVEIIDKM